MSGLLRRLKRSRAAGPGEVPPADHGAAPADAPTSPAPGAQPPAARPDAVSLLDTDPAVPLRVTGPALGAPAQGARGPAGNAAVPAGLDPAEAAARPPAGRRGRLRRRLRYLRRARELMLRDLGGLVYEVHRTGGGNMPAHAGLLAAKVKRLATLDAEAHALEAALAAPREHVMLFEPGVGGTCDACGELYASDARFCSRCGTPTTSRFAPPPEAEPAAEPPPAASERAPTLAEPAAEAGPAMPARPPEPVAPGAEAQTSELPPVAVEQPTVAGAEDLRRATAESAEDAPSGAAGAVPARDEAATGDWQWPRAGGHRTRAAAQAPQRERDEASGAEPDRGEDAPPRGDDAPRRGSHGQPAPPAAAGDDAPQRGSHGQPAPPATADGEPHPASSGADERPRRTNHAQPATADDEPHPASSGADEQPRRTNHAQPATAGDEPHPASSGAEAQPRRTNHAQPAPRAGDEPTLTHGEPLAGADAPAPDRDATSAMTHGEPLPGADRPGPDRDATPAMTHGEPLPDADAPGSDRDATPAMTHGDPLPGGGVQPPADGADEDTGGDGDGHRTMTHGDPLAAREPRR